MKFHEKNMKSHENCRHLLSALSDFIDGDLNLALCDEIEKHMADCENCQIVINTLKKTVELYQETSDAPVLPDDVKSRLYQEINLDSFNEPALKKKLKTEKSTLGGGCFWCLEAVYDELNGVLDVVSGYAGGDVPNPEYKSVVSGSTGHAEVVQVTFDPNVITFKEILEIFFSIHDPTTLNRQGNDVGTHYRSVIFYNADEQKQIAEQVIAEFEAENIWASPIITEVTELDEFYPAEDFHQKYFKKNPYQGYCRAVVAPKVRNIRKKYVNRLKQTT